MHVRFLHSAGRANDVLEKATPPDASGSVTAGSACRCHRDVADWELSADGNRKCVSAVLRGSADCSVLAEFALRGRPGTYLLVVDGRQFRFSNCIAVFFWIFRGLDSAGC